MARPRHENPTPAELEVLQVIWEQGPSTVRQVMNALNQERPRAYTSVMSLMNVMVEKGLLATKPKGRAFVYSARVSQAGTQSEIVKDLLNRVFDGSASALVRTCWSRPSRTVKSWTRFEKPFPSLRGRRGGT